MGGGDRQRQRTEADDERGVEWRWREIRRTAKGRRRKNTCQLLISEWANLPSLNGKIPLCS